MAAVAVGRDTRGRPRQPTPALVEGEDAMTGKDYAMFIAHGRKPAENLEDEIAPPGGISLREAMRAVGSGRAELQPTGLAIVYADGRRFRAVEGQPGLTPEVE